MRRMQITGEEWNLDEWLIPSGKEKGWLNVLIVWETMNLEIARRSLQL